MKKDGKSGVRWTPGLFFSLCVELEDGRLEVFVVGWIVSCGTFTVL